MWNVIQSGVGCRKSLFTSYKLSIITVCKNIADEIGDTCESIVGQTFRDFEWIVIDGASTDGTLAVLEKYHDRIDFFVSEPDSGVYNAMNKGIDAATGEYLLFLNGGDFLAEKDTLSKIFKNFPEAEIVYGNGYYFDPKIGKAKKEITPAACQMTAIFLAYSMICHQFIFFKKSLFDLYDQYNEDFKIAADADRIVVFRQNGCTIEKTHNFIAYFRLGGMSGDHSTRKYEFRCIQELYFKSDELVAMKCELDAQRSYKRVFVWGGNASFSVFSIDENVHKKRMNILNIPIFKIKDDGWKRRYLLFCFIPIWSLWVVENKIDCCFL